MQIQVRRNKYAATDEKVKTSMGTKTEARKMSVREGNEKKKHTHSVNIKGELTNIDLLWERIRIKKHVKRKAIRGEEHTQHTCRKVGPLCN